jgi:hypothetical protein
VLFSEGSMPAVTANLFFLEDLEDVSRTGQLAESDLRSLRTVADWIKTFMTGLNKDLGRAGPMSPLACGLGAQGILVSLLSTSPIEGCHRLPNL